jgi:hypothetical protein
MRRKAIGIEIMPEYYLMVANQIGAQAVHLPEIQQHGAT